MVLAGIRWEQILEVFNEPCDFVFVGCSAMQVIDHLTELIERGENQVHHVAGNFVLAFAQYVEHVFGVMGEFDDVRVAEESGSAFDGVESAKDAIEKLGILWRRFERDQILVQLLEEFLTFGEVVLKERGVLNDLLAHFGPVRFRAPVAPLGSIGIIRRMPSILRREAARNPMLAWKLRNSRSLTSLGMTACVLFSANCETVP